MNRPVVVRFAPSPTGPLHIGGVRTCLYNYLFARQHGGKLLFRIEDTDSQRFVPGAEEYIIESFKWLGIQFDEGVSFGGDHGPYRQSERRDIYKKYVQVLIDADKAYYAFDTKEELDAARAATPNFQYDASTRGQMRNSISLGMEKAQELIAAGEPYVVRFRIEPGEEVLVNDQIRGEVRINSSILDDKVLYKSADELLTYHLANIVDDHLMEVTHVIRGEEWLPSSPLHVLLYRAFGWEAPQFAHLPLLLAPEGNGKLSKRDGDKYGFPVFPLQWNFIDKETGEPKSYSGYRESGYLPEAVVNFLALLGWNPGNDQDFMTMDEMIKMFDLSKCSKNGAHFDVKRLLWFNHHYLQECDEQILVESLKKQVIENGADPKSDAYVLKAIQLMKERINLPQELWPQCCFFFAAPTSYDEKSMKKWWKPAGVNQEGVAVPASKQMVAELCEFLEAQEDWTGVNLEPKVMEWIAGKGYKVGAVMNAFRCTIVGEARGPQIFDITDMLGKEESLRRARVAVESQG